MKYKIIATDKVERIVNRSAVKTLIVYLILSGILLGLNLD